MNTLKNIVGAALAYDALFIFKNTLWYNYGHYTTQNKINGIVGFVIAIILFVMIFVMQYKEENAERKNRKRGQKVR